MATHPTSKSVTAGSSNEIMTAVDVAKFLRIPRGTVYKLARLGTIPSSRIGKHWRFTKTQVRDWFAKQCATGEAIKLR